MEHAVVSLTLTLSAGTSLAAPYQGEEQAQVVQGLVPIIAAQAKITLYCRKAYTIDDKVSEGLLRTVRPALNNAIGNRQAQAADDEEGRRLSKEIDDIGVER